MSFSILPTDQAFGDSPDAGLPDCLCSRCGLVIPETEVPVRAWPGNGSFEYRFHPACLGINSSNGPSAENDDFVLG